MMLVLSERRDSGGFIVPPAAVELCLNLLEAPVEGLKHFKDPEDDKLSGRKMWSKRRLRCFFHSKHRWRHGKTKDVQQSTIRQTRRLELI